VSNTGTSEDASNRRSIIDQPGSSISSNQVSALASMVCRIWSGAASQAPGKNAISSTNRRAPPSMSPASSRRSTESVPAWNRANIGCRSTSSATTAISGGS